MCLPPRPRQVGSPKPGWRFTVIGAKARRAAIKGDQYSQHDWLGRTGSGWTGSGEDRFSGGQVLRRVCLGRLCWCSSKQRQRSVRRLQRDGEGVTLINCSPTWGPLACCSSVGFFASGLVCHIKVDALPFRASAVPQPDHEIGQLSCLPSSPPCLPIQVVIGQETVSSLDRSPVHHRATQSQSWSTQRDSLRTGRTCKLHVERPVPGFEPGPPSCRETTNNSSRPDMNILEEILLYENLTLMSAVNR
ncbi:uncharacterized protein C1orf53 homolog isoform X1 [Gambusia affinis]|uniref:uncharacterized protein C1orf53 homolog isoform X1 n=1 Tax=Gambusia affinis TaxID=33528 RepID=UPI001CDD0989|nr:uncharacterized protein C1orf53 homolog isoform X1 [Gambusia affinis]